MSEQEAQQGTEPRERPGGWLRERPAYSLLAVGLVLYALVLIVQASRSDAPPALAQVGPGEAGTVSLLIAHPKKLVRDGPDEARQVLWAWLTCTASPPPAPYAVALEPINGGVAFVDKDGAPVAPRLVLTPTIQATTAATLYLRRAALVGNEPSAVTLTARLFDANGRELIPGGVRFSVYLETGWEAFWRHLGQRLLSPTTPLLTLAAGLVALAVQEYRRAEERRFQGRMKLEGQRLATEQERVAEEKRAAHQARLAEIDQIHRFIPYQLDEALKLYNEYQRRSTTLSEWQTDDVSTSLTAVWRAINRHDWQKIILTQAVSLLREQQYPLASEMVALVQSLDPDNQAARDIQLVTELAQPAVSAKDTILPLIERHGIEKVVETLQRVDGQYEFQRGDLVTRLLSQLRHNPEYADQMQQLLEADRVGHALLFQVDWPQLWSAAYLGDPRKIGVWLGRVGLGFNPFGPETAELDPRLPWYVIDVIYEEARGARPLLVTAAPGAGKTAAALMLAYNCGHPPANPRQPGTFPVYYPLRLVTAFAEHTSTILAPLVRATVREILRYLSLQPQGLLDLPLFSQDAMRRLLALAYVGSESLLAAAVGRLPPSLQKTLALGSLSESWSRPSRLRDEDWLDLLSEALPAGFYRYEWLVDVPGRMNALLPDQLPDRLIKLVDLATPLAIVGVHLKLFVADDVAGILGDPPGLDVVCLKWDEEGLRLMLDQRIRQTGGDSLMALCGPDVARDFETRLIQAAQGSPRRLVQLGNALLNSAASRAAGDPLLTEEDLEAALAKVQDLEIQPAETRSRYLTRLRQILATHFGASELRSLCFDLGIDYDDLPELGKTDKARALVEYLERRDRIPELVEIGQQLRPKLSWDGP